MKTPLTLPLYVGAQNDLVYIIAGKPPASNNDYPEHDAPRVRIARVYDGEHAAAIVAAVNGYGRMRGALALAEKALKMVYPLNTFADPSKNRFICACCGAASTAEKLNEAHLKTIHRNWCEVEAASAALRGLALALAGGGEGK